jgi:antirestriction protein ArdC
MRNAGIGGLYAKVQFNLQSEKGKEAFASVAFFGEEQEWSIGYKTINGAFDPAQQANVLREVELYEVSPVLHGANQLTGTISVKSEQKNHMMPVIAGMPMMNEQQQPRMIVIAAPEKEQEEDEPFNIFAEGLAQPLEADKVQKIQAELSERTGSKVDIVEATDSFIVFRRTTSDGKVSMYRVGYHSPDDYNTFMFGKPEAYSGSTDKPQIQQEIEVKPADESMFPAQPQQMPYRDDDQDEMNTMLGGQVGIGKSAYAHLIEIPQIHMMQAKSMLQPVFNYHNLSTTDSDNGIIVNGSISAQAIDALQTAVKAIGQTIGQSVGNLRTLAQSFNPFAIDGDNDGFAQDGTAFQRPYIPIKKPDMNLPEVGGKNRDSNELLDKPTVRTGKKPAKDPSLLSGAERQEALAAGDLQPRTMDDISFLANRRPENEGIAKYWDMPEEGLRAEGQKLVAARREQTGSAREATDGELFKISHEFSRREAYKQQFGKEFVPPKRTESTGRETFDASKPDEVMQEIPMSAVLDAMKEWSKSRSTRGFGSRSDVTPEQQSRIDASRKRGSDVASGRGQILADNIANLSDEDKDYIRENGIVSYLLQDGTGGPLSGEYAGDSPAERIGDLLPEGDWSTDSKLQADAEDIFASYEEGFYAELDKDFAERANPADLDTPKAKRDRQRAAGQGEMFSEDDFDNLSADEQDSILEQGRDSARGFASRNVNREGSGLWGTNRPLDPDDDEISDVYIEDYLNDHVGDGEVEFEDLQKFNDKPDYYNRGREPLSDAELQDLFDRYQSDDDAVREIAIDEITTRFYRELLDDQYDYMVERANSKTDYDDYDDYERSRGGFASLSRIKPGTVTGLPDGVYEWIDLSDDTIADIIYDDESKELFIAYSGRWEKGEPDANGAIPSTYIQPRSYIYENVSKEELDELGASRNLSESVNALEKIKTGRDTTNDDKFNFFGREEKINDVETRVQLEKLLLQEKRKENQAKKVAEQARLDLSDDEFIADLLPRPSRTGRDPKRNEEIESDYRSLMEMSPSKLASELEKAQDEYSSAKLSLDMRDASVIGRDDEAEGVSNRRVRAAAIERILARKLQGGDGMPTDGFASRGNRLDVQGTNNELNKWWSSYDELTDNEKSDIEQAYFKRNPDSERPGSRAYNPEVAQDDFEANPEKYGYAKDFEKQAIEALKANGASDDDAQNVADYWMENDALHDEYLKEADGDSLYAMALAYDNYIEATADDYNERQRGFGSRGDKPFADTEVRLAVAERFTNWRRSSGRNIPARAEKDSEEMLKNWQSLTPEERTSYLENASKNGFEEGSINQYVEALSKALGENRKANILSRGIESEKRAKAKREGAKKIKELLDGDNTPDAATLADLIYDRYNPTRDEDSQTPELFKRYARFMLENWKGLSKSQRRDAFDGSENSFGIEQDFNGNVSDLTNAEFLDTLQFAFDEHSSKNPKFAELDDMLRSMADESGFASRGDSGNRTVKDFDRINSGFDARSIRDSEPYERVERLRDAKAELTAAIDEAENMLDGLDEDSPEWEEIYSAQSEMESNLIDVENMMEEMISKKGRLDDAMSEAATMVSDAEELRQTRQNIDTPSAEDLEEMSFEDANYEFISLSRDITEFVNEHDLSVDWNPEKQAEVDKALRDGDYDKANDILYDATQEIFDAADDKYRTAEAENDDYPYLSDEYGFSSRGGSRFDTMDTPYSSAIEAVHYDRNTGELHVAFKPGQTGGDARYYTYSGVPADYFDNEISGSNSIGRVINDVKKNYDVEVTNPRTVDAINGRRDMAPSTGGRLSSIQDIDVRRSAALYESYYDPNTEELVVTFKDKDGNAGGSYIYEGVNADEAQELASSSSKGKVINKLKASKSVRRASATDRMDRDPSAGEDVGSGSFEAQVDSHWGEIGPDEQRRYFARAVDSAINAGSGTSAEEITADAKARAFDDRQIAMMEMQAESLGIGYRNVDVGSSAALNRVQYDPDKRELRVEYRGRDGKGTGEFYVYENVPQSVVDDLEASDSRGSTLRRVRDDFDFRTEEAIPESAFYSMGEPAERSNPKITNRTNENGFYLDENGKATNYNKRAYTTGDVQKMNARRNGRDGFASMGQELQDLQSKIQIDLKNPGSRNGKRNKPIDPDVAANLANPESDAGTLVYPSTNEGDYIRISYNPEKRTYGVERIQTVRGFNRDEPPEEVVVDTADADTSYEAGSLVREFAENYVNELRLENDNDRRAATYESTFGRGGDADDGFASQGADKKPARLIDEKYDDLREFGYSAEDEADNDKMVMKAYLDEIGEEAPSLEDAYEFWAERAQELREERSDSLMATFSGLRDEVNALGISDRELGAYGLDGAAFLTAESLIDNPLESDSTDISEAEDYVNRMRRSIDQLAADMPEEYDYMDEEPIDGFASRQTSAFNPDTPMALLDEELDNNVSISNLINRPVQSLGTPFRQSAEYEPSINTTKWRDLTPRQKNLVSDDLIENNRAYFSAMERSGATLEEIDDEVGKLWDEEVRANITGLERALKKASDDYSFWARARAEEMNPTMSEKEIDDMLVDLGLSERDFDNLHGKNFGAEELASVAADLENKRREIIENIIKGSNQRTGGDRPKVDPLSILGGYSDGDVFGLTPRGFSSRGESGSKKKTKEEVYAEMTKQLIDALSESEKLGKWKLPWRRTGMPENGTTGHKYSGSNWFFLTAMADVKGYKSNKWATYDQWQGVGGQVRKGEKATSIFVPIFIKGKEKADGTEDKGTIRFISRSVFNLDQIDGMPEDFDKKEILPESERVADLEKTISEIPAVIKNGGDKAFFQPSGDFIQVPDFENFNDARSYYSTVAHELMHWTGGDGRLGREQMGTFGTPEYAYEELVAEIASAMFMAAHNIEPNIQENHGPYLASWIKKLKDDPSALERAMKDAQSAVNYVLDISPNAKSKFSNGEKTEFENPDIAVPTEPVVAVEGLASRGDWPTPGGYEPSEFDMRTALSQIGRGNLMAISGTRANKRNNEMVLPVNRSQQVIVGYDAGSDTYFVRAEQIITNGKDKGKTRVLGQWDNVYADELGETAYQASLKPSMLSDDNKTVWAQAFDHPQTGSLLDKNGQVYEGGFASGGDSMDPEELDAMDWAYDAAQDYLMEQEDMMPERPSPEDGFASRANLSREEKNEIIAIARRMGNRFTTSVVGQYDRNGELSDKQWDALNRMTLRGNRRGLASRGDAQSPVSKLEKIAIPRMPVEYSENRTSSDAFEDTEMEIGTYLESISIAMKEIIGNDEFDKKYKPRIDKIVNDMQDERSRYAPPPKWALDRATKLHDEMISESRMNGGGGLASRGDKKPRAPRASWSPEDRQRYADGDKLRSTRRPGKRREGPSASEYGFGSQGQLNSGPIELVGSDIFFENERSGRSWGFEPIISRVASKFGGKENMSDRQLALELNVPLAVAVKMRRPGARTSDIYALDAMRLRVAGPGDALWGENNDPLFYYDDAGEPILDAARIPELDDFAPDTVGTSAPRTSGARNYIDATKVLEEVGIDPNASPGSIMKKNPDVFSIKIWTRIIGRGITQSEIDTLLEAKNSKKKSSDLYSEDELGAVIKKRGDSLPLTDIFKNQAFDSVRGRRGFPQRVVEAITEITGRRPAYTAVATYINNPRSSGNQTGRNPFSMTPAQIRVMLDKLGISADEFEKFRSE